MCVCVCVCVCVCLRVCMHRVFMRLPCLLAPQGATVLTQPLAVCEKALMLSQRFYTVSPPSVRADAVAAACLVLATKTARSKVGFRLVVLAPSAAATHVPVFTSTSQAQRLNPPATATAMREVASTAPELVDPAQPLPALSDADVANALGTLSFFLRFDVNSTPPVRATLNQELRKALNKGALGINWFALKGRAWGCSPPVRVDTLPVPARQPNRAW